MKESIMYVQDQTAPSGFNASKDKAMRTGRNLIIGWAALAFTFGCAEPVDDINQVQPYYIKKSTLDGEWMHKQTVVDQSPESPIGFIGLQGDMERLKWSIDENYLYAFRTYETVPGIDEDSTRPGSEYEGGVVMQCPILRHFDIQRTYNTATGENTNVIGENAFDRPWYEREFMRIDWDGCGIPGPADLSWVLNNYSMVTDTIREHEAFDPGHLQVDEDYIQVTAEMTFQASGNTCYTAFGSGDCRTGQGRLRLSFAKIPKDEFGNKIEDFEPRPYRDIIDLEDDSGRSLATIGLSVPLGAASNEQDFLQFACTPELLEFLQPRADVDETYHVEDCGNAFYAQGERHGFFRSERTRFDRRLGAGRDDHREFFANIFNIWVDPYMVVDGQKVSKPMSERTPKPVVYYLSTNFPDNLESVNGEISNDWDAPFTETVVSATGKDEATVRAEIQAQTERELGLLAFGGDIPGQCQPNWMFLAGDNYAAQSMFQVRRNTCSPCGIEMYLRRNPGMVDVAEVGMTAQRGQVNFDLDGDGKSASNAEQRIAAVYENLTPGKMKNVCAGLTHYSRTRDVEHFTWQQIGDVRFSMMTWINESQPDGPLGYGPNANDKETGQIISGSANMYGAAIDTYARFAADIVRAMNEDLDINTLLSGHSYSAWLADNRTFGNMDLEITEEVAADLDSRFAGFDVQQAYGRFEMPDGEIDYGALVRNLQRRLSDTLPSDPIHQASLAPVGERQDELERMAEHPELRARLLTNDVVSLARAMHPHHGHHHSNDGLPPEVEETALKMAMNPQGVAAEYTDRMKVFTEHNVYLAEFIDDSVIGQALAMKGMDPEEVYQQLRREIYRGVMLHEIGHTVGLTHNFEGSRDALNYHDEFWQMRGAGDGTLNVNANGAPDRSKEYRYSTIMDYGSRFNADTKGLGKYDHAAIKFGYGRLTEVFSEDVPMDARFSNRVWLDGYTAIPNLLGGDLANLNKRIDVPLANHVAEYRAGLLENTAKLMEDPARPKSDYYYSREVPYDYCFDYWRGQIDCQVWDEGASYEETVQGAIQRYWNYYAFNSFRRGRSENGFINSYFGQQGRVGFYMTEFFRFYFFYRNYNIGIRNDLERASLRALNFINQVLGTPLPGPHCLDSATNMYMPYSLVDEQSQANCNPIEVPVGTGRNHDLMYNDEYLFQLDHIGTYFDKVNMLIYLSNPNTNFFRVGNQGDQRQFSISYYRAFRPELITLYRDMMMSWLDQKVGSTYGNYVMGGTDSRIEPRALVAGEAFGQTPANMVGMPQLYAPVGYNTVFQSLLYASVFNTSVFDSELDFDEYLAITEVGSGDDRTFAAGIDVKTFEHPETDVIYQAGNTVDGLSISHALLTRADEFVNTVWIPAKQAYNANPSDEAVRAAFETADQKLGRFTDLISDLRFLRSYVDFGRD